MRKQNKWWEKEIKKSPSVHFPSGIVCTLLSPSYEKEVENKESGDEKIVK